jgi:hypothetical protein
MRARAIYKTIAVPDVRLDVKPDAEVDGREDAFTPPPASINVGDAGLCGLMGREYGKRCVMVPVLYWRIQQRTLVNTGARLY